MAELIVIDTDILIDAGRGVHQAIEYIHGLSHHSRPTVSTVTQMELIVGCRDKTELRGINRFLERFQILKIDETISDQAVKLLKHYRLSHGLLIPDALIAAIALVWNAPLVSKNQRDYRFIPLLNLLPYPPSEMV